MGRGNVTANLAVTSFTPSADIGGASKKIPTAVGRVCLHDHVDSDAVVSVEFVGGKCSDARCEDRNVDRAAAARPTAFSAAR
jgi:hypothetical protein